MRVTVEQLRQKYPEPVKSQPGGITSPDTYCVGGAFLRELGYGSFLVREGANRLFKTRGRTEEGFLLSDAVLDAKGERCETGLFPSPALLSKGLRQVNPFLTAATAAAFAEVIARKNDTGNFETAWGLLGDALAWTGVEWTESDLTAMREWATEGECIG